MFWCTQCQAEQASEKAEVYLSAGGTETILICPYSMPAEAADLVSTGAREEVDIINFQWFHTQRALHRVVLYLRVPGHPTISHYWTRQLSQDRDRRSSSHWNRDKQELSYIQNRNQPDEKGSAASSCYRPM